MTILLIEDKELYNVTTAKRLLKPKPYISGSHTKETQALKFMDALTGIRGVNFINVLRAAFTRADPKKSKKTDHLTVLLVLSESAGIKAARAHRMLMKLTTSHIF